MAERIELTESDLIEALLAAQAPDAQGGGALSVRELMTQTGLSEKGVRKRLWKLLDAGRLECQLVGKPTLDGRTQKVPAYRLRSE